MQKIKKHLQFVFAVTLLIGTFGCGKNGNGNSPSSANLNGTGLQSVNLTWSPPTTNADGTPITDIAGYRVYMGSTPGKLLFLTDVGNTTSYTVSGLQPGSTFYFGITTYDSLGSESAISNLISG